MFLEYRALSWWYWLAIAACLTVGVAGSPAGFVFAIAIAAVQLIHFAVRERSVAAFAVQVRLGYLAVLLLFFTLPENLRWLYWLAVIGTWATVLFGYCLMARMVSLLPWNRKESFSLGLLQRTFLSAPTRGSVLFPSA